MHYSVQPRDRIFVKGYGFLSFAKKLGTNIVKNISKNLSSKYSQKHFHYPRKSATDAFKTVSKTEILKAAEATGDLIGGKVMGASKSSQQNNSNTVTNGNDKEIPEERYISPEERQKIIDWMRLT